MGRLFWKFFFFFMLAQLVTAVGVSLAIWMRNGEAFTRAEITPGIFNVRLLDTASVTLEQGGESALRTLLEDWAREAGPAVYAVDSNGREILGRPVPRVSAAVPLTEGPTDILATRRVALANGQSYLFVVAES